MQGFQINIYSGGNFLDLRNWQPYVLMQNVNFRVRDHTTQVPYQELFGP